VSALAPVARAHHERLDGSGYHRGARGAELPLPARVLAAADACHAMTSPGRIAAPYRRSKPRRSSAGVWGGTARRGRGRGGRRGRRQRVPRLERPAGLTEREAEVVGMLARGPQTKQIARALGISVKTADRHIERLPHDRGFEPGRGDAVRHGTRARRMGELPLGAGFRR